MCEAAGVSRAGYYRAVGKADIDGDVELRDLIQKIAIGMPAMDIGGWAPS